MMLLKILLLNVYAFAEEAHHAAEHVAGHGDPHAIPWWSLFVQLFNFTFIFVILFVALRKSVKAHFANRASEFKVMVDRADAARREAEQGKKLINDRLAKLESGAEASLTTAKAEAEVLKKRLLDEASAISSRLEVEAKRTATTELEKAKAELRKELLLAALKNSNENLQKSLGSSEQKQLQNEFVEKMVGG